jgi:dTDP-4-dehydrorhamnose 3,5-epimerase
VKFTETSIGGVCVVEIERIEDDRGFFARSFCVDEFVARGLDPAVVQCNISFNRQAGTVRGMHYQAPPVSETKLVRCTQGGILDVVVDLRPESPTYQQHVGVELTAENRKALFISKGLLAHGFQTLADDTEVAYQMGEKYVRGADRGVRYDDPALALEWPLPVNAISDKDRTWPLLVP